MSNPTSLLAFLASPQDPSHAKFCEIAKSITQNPALISTLTAEGNKDAVLLNLTTKSHRLAQIYQHLLPHQRRQSNSTPAHDIAKVTIDLLSMLPSLYDLIDITRMVELFVAAMKTCLAVRPCPSLHKVASITIGCGNLLEYLAADLQGSEVIQQWAGLPATSTYTTSTLEAWTTRLNRMTKVCPTSHGTAEDSHKLCKLLKLLSGLRELEIRLSPSTNKTSRAFDHFKELRLGMPNSTKSSDKGSQNDVPDNANDHPSTLQEENLLALEFFNLSVPRSELMVRTLVRILEHEKMAAILATLAASFPCKLCKERLQEACLENESTTAPTDDPFIDRCKDAGTPVENRGELQLDILGERMGIWRILLSAPAIKSLQRLSHDGHSTLIKARLEDLSNGHWVHASRAGSEKQRRSLPVRPAKTEFEKDMFLLWQLDVGQSEKTNTLQQVIKVWQVGNSATITKAIDQVIDVQRSYSPQTVQRCYERLLDDHKRQIPVHFGDELKPSATSVRPSGNLDIRCVDQEALDMANKFYAFTEPVMRAILEKDLSAEFPLDLSLEEARIIKHFRTASLILGRSGTGKTTCLIFKLVGKYLARKLVLDERPIRQVLLTRSNVLAEKLRKYTRDLIRTLKIQATGQTPGRTAIPITADSDFTNRNALTLTPEMYPLVCTFDQFLAILENTVWILDRQNFDEPHKISGGVGTQKRVKGSLVNMQAFKLDYWPRLPRDLTKDLSIELIYPEIMGVIKGSASSRTSLAPLSRDVYLTTSSRLAPTFVLETDRARVYEIYQKYEAMRIGRGDSDFVDRVVNLLTILRKDTALQQVLGATFEEIFIDEVQDQRCIDIELLLTFIKDPRGFHFAGDTAQAISQDSTFRFNDVKDIFFHHFASTSDSAHQAELSRPSLFTLSKNYRSHQGILSLASFVMELLWKAFPETIDKLDPEVGNLSGPRPVFFVNCDTSILTSNRVGQVELHGHKIAFGAEQVILVRDQQAKEYLRCEIGDAAIVLTILESKGMEFHDVILWNFFTSSPYQAGVRRLNGLVSEGLGHFDARQHAHLYVAITRAQLQMFFIETDESAVLSVIKLFTRDAPETLIETTQPSDPSFKGHFEALQPGNSSDPLIWLKRANEFMQYNRFDTALICFRHAKDKDGEKLAKAHLREEEGRICYAKCGDMKVFEEKLRAAAGYFAKLTLWDDAVRNLVAVGDVSAAAEILEKQGQFKQAAELYIGAKLHLKAAYYYSLDGNHNKAVLTLKEGGEFNELVKYLGSHRRHIPPDLYQSLGRLCGLLLKRNEVATDLREAAITMLGSPVDQEKFFVQYEMYDELLKFFSEQREFSKLFYLQTKRGLLEEALKTALTHGADFAEADVNKVLDYVCAARLHSRQDVLIFLEWASQSNPNAKLHHRVQQWEAGLRSCPWRASFTLGAFATVQDPTVKSFVSLQLIFAPASSSNLQIFDGISNVICEEAIEVTKALYSKDDRNALNTAFLLLGIWKEDDGQEDFSVLPWSPIRQNFNKTDPSQILQKSKKWVSEKLSASFLAMDVAARNHFNAEWPIRCSHFATAGRCPAGSGCRFSHDLASTKRCLGKVEALIQWSNICCKLAVLYYRGMMPRDFQVNYLSIRRHWLERLIRELTYVSSFEQDVSTIAGFHAELFRGSKSLVIASSVEELLYHRMDREWTERSKFSAILEQRQLARAFGPNVENRFLRALATKMYYVPPSLMILHPRLLYMLETDALNSDASNFKQNLDILLTNLCRVNEASLASMHAVTAMFEYLVTYLILRTCVTVFVMPQSWTEFNLPWISARVLASTSDQDKKLYEECFLRTIQGLLEILSRLELALNLSAFSLNCGGRKYPPALLQQRNVELVAISFSNIMTWSIRPNRVRELFVSAKLFFGYNSTKALSLQCRSITDLTLQLPTLFEKYAGKNRLYVASKGASQEQKFVKDLKSKPGVVAMSLEDIYARLLQPTAAMTSTGWQATATETTNQYSATEMQAVVKIQGFWRNYLPKLQYRRSWLETLPKEIARQLLHIDPAPSMAVQFLLITQGVDVLQILRSLSELASQCHKSTFALLDSIEPSSKPYESLDNALGRLLIFDTAIKDISSQFSDTNLRKVVKERSIEMLQIFLSEIENKLADADTGLCSLKAVLYRLDEGRAKTENLIRS